MASRFGGWNLKKQQSLAKDGDSFHSKENKHLVCDCFEQLRYVLCFPPYVLMGLFIHQDPIPIHRKSYYLLGRDTLVVDIPLEHPSCSKQHAVIQHRTVETSKGKRVRPYVVDLGR